MKKNIAPLLAIAFIVAIVSSGLFYGLFASKLRNTSSDLPRQTIVIASRKLARGTVLVASDLRISEFRSRTVFAASFTAPEQVVGSTTIEPLEENQVVTRSVLASRTQADGGAIPAGMRALTIHIFESGGVLALVTPGSKVDVQSISDRKDAAVVHTILRNIEVVSAGTLPESVAGRFSTPYVTVLVRPEDADVLAGADTGTRLRLALRNRLDGAESPTPLTISSAFSTRHQKPVHVAED